MAPKNQKVSVVMIFLDAAEFIKEAIESIFSQTYPNWELILIDDGSSDGSSEIARRYADTHPEQVRYLEHSNHANKGMSASRNLGIKYATGDYLTFLDADDTWYPNTLETQVSILESQPEAGMLYGSAEWWYSWTGRPQDAGRDFCDFVTERGVQPNMLIYPPSLLNIFLHDGGAVPCLGSVMVRRQVIEDVGGFEESFQGLYEDQAFYAKVSLKTPIFLSENCFSRYRQHAGSCCSVTERTGQQESLRLFFLNWLELYLSAQGVKEPAIWKTLGMALERSETTRKQQVWIAQLERGKEWLEEQWQNWKKIAEDREKIILDQQIRIAQMEEGKESRGFRSSSLIEIPSHALRRIMTRYGERNLQSFRQTAKHQRPDLQADPTSLAPFEGREPANLGRKSPDASSDGGVFGNPRRVTPLSREWGFDRGLPIDRYYIENFLERNAKDVCGRVLEIGEASYTRKYGGARVTASDVLDIVKENSEATILADLTTANHVPSQTFDCIILTQTLHLIYDVRAALKTTYRILKPGGVLLATFPGITRITSREWAGSWFWGFTTFSARRLFEEFFTPDTVQVESHGNVLAASAFLYGLAVEELGSEELDFHDPEYEVILAVRAVKPKTVFTQSLQVKKAKRSPRLPIKPSRRALILMYHRIAESASDPWMLCVSPRRFAEHLEILRNLYHPIPLQRITLAETYKDHLPLPVAITFDDGYADNFHNARPLLEKYDIPATIFVVSGYLEHPREFWWDELEKIFLQPRNLPEDLHLTIHGRIYRWELGEEARYNGDTYRHASLSKAEEKVSTARQRTYTSLWQLMLLLSEEERQPVLEELRDWAGLELGIRPAHRPLSQVEANELIQGGLIEIGSHTHTHANLASLPIDQQRIEINRSKALLEKLLGCSITSFAYPHGNPGDYSTDSINLVRQAGFVRACSVSNGVVKPSTDQFRLPRYHVQDWDGDEFLKHLASWFNN